MAEIKMESLIKNRTAKEWKGEYKMTLKQKIAIENCIDKVESEAKTLIYSVRTYGIEGLRIDMKVLKRSFGELK